MQETPVQFLGQEDLLEKQYATPKYSWASLVAQLVKNLPAMRETWVRSLGWDDISLPTEVHIVKAMVFPVGISVCESWTIKKAEHQRIDAFELWC